MKDLTLEQKKALVAIIKKMTGAESLVLMLCDTKVPCDEEQVGGTCNSPHNMEVMVEGYRGPHAKGFLLGAIEQIMDGIASGSELPIVNPE